MTGPSLPAGIREVLDAPEITCDVDVSVRHEGGRGWVQLHSGQALRGGTVAAVSSAGGRVEVACWGVEHWHAQLARAATVSVPQMGGPPPPPHLEVPLDVLLGTGEALRSHRPDVVDELARRAGTDDPVHTRDLLVGLHTSVVGRLLAVVAAGGGDRRARVGWVSWLLFGDGWRALVPVRVGRRPSVRFDRVEPADLGPQVARLMSVVRGRR